MCQEFGQCNIRLRTQIMMKKEEDLISRYLSMNLEGKEVDELDKMLRDSPELRNKFYDQTNVVSALEEEFSSKLPDEKVVAILPAKPNRKILALAASFLLGFGFIAYSFLLKPKPIAILVSNENAAWESSLPTTPGSELIPGQMSLKSGVATIRFSSGAEVTLEAPAQIELNTEMEGKLNQGNAIIHVPKSAQGFVLITPSGYAVDHGTSFGVSIRPNQTITDFKVLEGEISVHSQSGDSLFLNENESVTLRPAGISEKSFIHSEEIPSTTNEKGKVIRIPSNGKSRSIIRSDDAEYLNPDYLMVKLDNGNKLFERRSLINFHYSEINWLKAKKVMLRLNLVPCGLGSRVYLPKINRFQVYALAGFSGIKWENPIAWKDAPAVKSLELVGKFEIPRSQERGTVVIETPELLHFIQKNNADEYTFLLLLETPENQGGGLVHAFASDSHPESTGPCLEVHF